ncbi:MAG: hypothetical protein FD125_2816 [bacterium]|nr:MAG: hypothetical protein FD125_2816 [bacterium]
MKSHERQQARHRGKMAETLAAVWLRLKFYRILARGLAGRRGSGAGEVDIVARRGKIVAFVEVKSRPSPTEAAESLGPAQRRRIERAASAFLARHPDLTGCDIRFDAILMAPGRLPRHIPDAWRPEAC